MRQDYRRPRCGKLCPCDFGLRYTADAAARTALVDKMEQTTTATKQTMKITNRRASLPKLTNYPPFSRTSGSKKCSRTPAHTPSMSLQRHQNGKKQHVPSHETPEEREPPAFCMFVTPLPSPLAHDHPDLPALPAPHDGCKHSSGLGVIQILP